MISSGVCIKNIMLWLYSQGRMLHIGVLYIKHVWHRVRSDVVFMNILLIGPFFASTITTMCTTKCFYM